MDLREYLLKQKSWLLSAFGPGDRDAGLIEHIKKELNEIEHAPGDLEEWIDVIILGFEGAIRNSNSVDDVLMCLCMKQEKNIARSWPDWTTADLDKPIEHIDE